MVCKSLFLISVFSLSINPSFGGISGIFGKNLAEEEVGDVHTQDDDISTDFSLSLPQKVPSIEVNKQAAPMLKG